MCALTMRCHERTRALHTTHIGRRPHETTRHIRLPQKRPWERYVVGATVGIGAALAPTAVAACAVVVTLAIVAAIKRWAPEDAVPVARTRR